MAFRARKSAASLSLGLLLASAAPARAQDILDLPPTPRTFEAAQPVEAKLREAAAARAAGNCLAHASALNDASRILEDVVRPALNLTFSDRLRGTDARGRTQTQLYVDSGYLDRLDRRISAERAEPCGGGTEGHDAVMADLPVTGPEVQSDPLDSSAAAERLSQLILQATIGHGEMSIPRTNYGFQRDGLIGTAEDLPASFSERQVPMLVFQGSASILGVGEFFIGYAEGDARNRAELSVGPAGTARGAVYTDEAQSGNTGASGNVGISVDTDVSVRNLSAAYRIAFAGVAEGPQAPAEDVDLRTLNRLLLRATVGVTGEYRDRDHRGVVAITTPVLFNQTLDQGVRELELGIVVGAEAVVPLGTRARFTLGGEVGLLLYDFDLTSLETVNANFGPDQAFTTRLDRGESGVGYTGAIRGEFVIDVSGRAIDGGARGIDLVVGGGGRFVSDRSQVVNPSSGTFVQNGGTSFLRTRSASDWYVVAGIRLRWRRAEGR